jgi:hypothetical protein
MLTIASLKKIDPSLSYLSDEELEVVRVSFYELGQLMFDDWHKNKISSKNPACSLTINQEGPTI